jgi:hypothetical protein
LTVGIEIFPGNRNVAGRLDHEHIGLAGWLEFEAIGRAPGDDDVIKVAKRQGTEHRMQRAAAGMDEDHLVGIRVTEQLLLRLLGATARQRDIVVAEEHEAARDGVARAGNRSCFHMMMAQRRLIAEVGRDRPRRFETDHASWRP